MQDSFNPLLSKKPKRPLLPDVLGLELAGLIEQSIIRLEFAPGSHLTELQICEEFDVSRSPVRDAFRKLESEGLVVRHKRRGIRVTPMTLQDLNEIYVVRTPLEVIAATLAAENATDEDLAFLSEQVERLNAALRSKDSDEFFEANMAYFDRVHGITGNRTLENILRTIEKQAMRYRYFAHSYSRQMQENSVACLRKILGHLKAREIDAVRLATEEMMVEAHRMIAEILTEHPSMSAELE